MILVRYKNLIPVIAILALFIYIIPAEAKLTAMDAKNVWNRVAKATELNDIPFSVKEEETPNAWVKNGKSVTVTTGLLNMLEKQSELYCVLAHEAGHAKLGHYENTVKHGVGLSVVAVILANILGGGLAETAAGVGANLAYAGWSREQEVEADDYSVHIAHKSGEDPVGLYSAILKLSNISDNSSKSDLSGFNSHPPDERRLVHIRNEILSIDPKAKFPDDTESNVQRQQMTNTDTTEKTIDTNLQKSGNHDLDPTIESMKKEEAARKDFAVQTS